jgi:hypothetical protein
VSLLWNLAFAILASIGAALILLVGVSAVLGFGILGLALLFLLIKTAVNLTVAFVLSVLVSIGAFLTSVRMATSLASRRVAFSGRWQWCRSPLRKLRKVVVRLRSYSRSEPRSEQLVAFVGLILPMAVILLIAYLEIWGLDSWTRMRTARLPTRIPVEQVGRRSLPQILTVSDAAKYARARRETIGAMKRTLVQSTRRSDPLRSRCGSVLAALPAERDNIAELIVDLTEAPPIIKREYTLTEDQLTVVLSELLQSETAPITLDCVKLHHDSIKLFTTTVDSDGATENQGLGISVTKVAGRLQILLEELSIGRSSFQLGWLGIGVTGDRSSPWGDDAKFAKLEEALRAFDSRIFRINVNEGYIRIITWRLPSMVAARAADVVGHVREAAEYNVAPNQGAAPLGTVNPTDLLYVLERTKDWLYACSEVSGRCGWLPVAAFMSLEDDVQVANLM